MDRYVRPCLPDPLDIAERDAGVDVAEVQHGRHLRNLMRAGDDLAAVIADGEVRSRRRVAEKNASEPPQQ